MNVTRWTAWGLVGIALLLFVYSQGRADQQASVVEHEGYALLSGHTTAQRVQDSLGAIMRRDSSHADSLAKHPRTVTVITAHHDTVQMVDTVWVQQQIADLGHAYATCSEARTLCQARSDSLERSLRAVLASKRPRVGWFLGPCLEATTSSAHLGLCGGFGLRF